ncbi:PASTA domain-containing protein [Olsenella sp. HMSC062G07]|uniref:PASTA domain-containing protein n=1 Tax=Olsenella sp. HMSC062G07 TaxID=1739330 RepID=UPI000A8E5044|nr:PASTA domain-containing protein [Olsenella sp. HMSC062G07]
MAKDPADSEERPRPRHLSSPVPSFDLTSARTTDAPLSDEASERGADASFPSDATLPDVSHEQSAPAGAAASSTSSPSAYDACALDGEHLSYDACDLDDGSQMRAAQTPATEDVTGEVGAFKAADIQVPVVPSLGGVAGHLDAMASPLSRIPPWLLIICVAAVLATIASTTILTSCFGLFAGTRLVNVVGEGADEARADLEARGYKVNIEEQQTQAQEDEGRVIATTPAADSHVPVGATVTLKVGRGANQTQAVPDLRGMTLDDALAQIAGTTWFVKDDVTYAQSDSVEQGRVIAQGPAAGTQKTKGTKVDLVVSEGRIATGDANGAAVTVPDVIGMPLADATTLLEGMGLSVVNGPELYDAVGAAGTVQEVNPGVGSPVAQDATVTIRAVATR